MIELRKSPSPTSTVLDLKPDQVILGLHADDYFVERDRRFLGATSDE